MKAKLGRILRLRNFSWIYAVAAFLFLLGGATFFAVLNTPLNEEALKLVLKQEMLGPFRLKNLVITKNSFQWKNLEWNFELSAEVEKVWNIPVKVKTLNLEGRKGLFRTAELLKATLRFSSEDKNFKGGLVFNSINSGAYFCDLTNLEFHAASIQKKMGEIATLSFQKTKNPTLNVEFIHDGVSLPLEVTATDNSLVLQIPKTKITTKQQKLPFVYFNEIPSSGDWTLASRIEFRDNLITEASSVKVDKAIVALSKMNSAFIRNGRGVGLLSLDLSSSENLANGKFSLDLENATFELNEGHYFKTDKTPFLLTGEVLQNNTKISFVSDGSKLDAEFGRDGTYSATLNDFELSLLPQIKNTLPSLYAGLVSGTMTGKITHDALGLQVLNIDSIVADEANMRFDEFKLPGFQLAGQVTYEGKFKFDVADKKSVFDGALNLRKASFSLGSVYQKAAEEPMVLKLKAVREDNSWKTFLLSAWIQDQQVELKRSDSHLLLSFPKAFKSQRGLLSGSITLPLCKDKVCENADPIAYNLRLSDFESDNPLLKDLKLSGKVQKTNDLYELENFSLVSDHEGRVVLDGKLEKFKKAILSVSGNFDYKNLATSNPFLFFKEFPLKEAEFNFNVQLKKDEQTWKLSTKANLENKRLNFENLSFTQSGMGKINQQNKSTYTGSAELNLESYLYRNEAAVLTSTLFSDGNLSSFDDLLMRGKYAAKLVLASTGLNLNEFVAGLRVRVSGSALVDQTPITLLIAQGLASYAKEKQKIYAKKLASCYPKKMKGKFDFDYNQGRWNLGQSVFQGTDKDSMVKMQGVLGDLSSINVVTHYLPGPKCEQALADCLGDAFPKGGMTFEVTGPFKDPETDFDFAFIDQSLEKCRAREAKGEISRDVATGEAATPLDTRDQSTRIKELKAFYKSRKYEP